MDVFELLFVALCSVCCLAAQVDPKLDFEPAKVIDLNDSAAAKSSKELPNIRGVRVVVETSKGSPESKSSEADSSDSSSSSDRSSIGVRTDVTFEVSNESNETFPSEVTIISNNKNETKEEPDIPIIFGRKPLKDLTTWKPLIRVIPDSEDKSRKTWFRDLPKFMWTTERAHYNPNIPGSGADSDTYYSYNIYGWHPCNCNRQHIRNLRPWQPPFGNKEHEIDDKLGEPFH